jgi:hypothetical protein
MPLKRPPLSTSKKNVILCNTLGEMPDAATLCVRLKNRLATKRLKIHEKKGRETRVQSREPNKGPCRALSSSGSLLVVPYDASDKCFLHGLRFVVRIKAASSSITDAAADASHLVEGEQPEKEEAGIIFCYFRTLYCTAQS